MMKHTGTAFRLALLLLAALLAVGLVACRKTGDDPATGSTGSTGGTSGPDSTEEEEPLDLPEGLDFDYAEFRILARGDADYYNEELYFADGASGSAVDQAVFRRQARIEETYFVEMSMSTLGEAEIDTYMNVNSLAAGLEDTYHLVANHGRNSTNYVINALTADWNLLPYTNLDASWWNQDARQQWTAVSGSIYMMTGDISYLSVGQAVGMFFNKTIINNAGLVTPYERVRNGEWTFEVFREYVTTTDANLNGDNSGNLATDSFGYVTGWWRGPMNIIYSTGQHWLEVTEDSISVIPSTANNLVNAFDDYFDLLFDSGACAMGGGDYTSMSKALEEGRATFYDEIVLRAETLKQTELDFGLVPMPKYDSTVDGYYTFVNAATNTFVIPRIVTTDAATAEMASVVLECMAYYGQKEVLPTYYEDILTYNSMTDMDSVEMMGVIRDSLSYDLGYYLAEGAGGNVCDTGYIMASERAARGFVTVYESLRNLGDARIEDWLDLA